MKVYIIGSLDNIDNIRKLADFLRETNEFLVNDSWISHGPTPDIEYFKYSKYRNWGKTTALITPNMKSIFSLDAGFIEDADIIINLQPSGNSSSVEGGMAFRAQKMTVLLIVDKEESEYRKIEVMYSCYSIISTHGKFIDGGWKSLIEKFKNREHLKYFKQVYNNFSKPTYT